MSTDAVPVVRVEQLDETQLDHLGVKSWPIWTKAPSEFDWSYDEQERCLFIEGEVTVVTPKGSVEIRAGDFVTFDKGLSCRWMVKKTVRKYYRFG